MTYSLNTLQSPSSSPPRSSSVVGRFASEIVLVIGFLALALWLLALLTYSQQDAAWSSSGMGLPLANRAGRLGAWVADFSYFFAGFSIWWCVAAFVRLWLSALAQRLRGDAGAHAAGSSLVSGRGNRWTFGVGLVILVCASAALEWSRLYSLETHLPDHSGGALGYMVGSLGVKWLGFAGTGLVAIVLGVAGTGWVFQFSWIQVAERVGAVVDEWVQTRREKRELAQDMQLGQKAAREREEIPLDEYEEIPIRPDQPVATEWVQPEPKKVESKKVQPTRIEPVKSESIRTEPVRTEPVRSEPSPSTPIVKERQKPLITDVSNSKLPQVSLLDGALLRQETVAPETLEMTSRLIEKKLKDFGVDVRVVLASPGPVITRYEIEPATGVKGSQIVGLAKDLARSLSLVSIRVVETIPGKNYMALELPNAKRQSITLTEILGSQVYHEAKSLLTMGLGKDIIGNPVVVDLAKMPHVLVAGTTGSGKSVGINAMILSLLFKAEARDVRLLMIDPKMLEMSVYEGIPHLLAPVVTDMRQAAHGLTWCVAEMERRYKLLSKLGVRNLAGYNAKIDEATAREAFIYNPFSLTPEAPEPLTRLPHIVVVIDELADLMMVVGKKIEELIARLAQKARAAGIHLILATQRPSVDVITGLIKANIPTRISFKVSSKIDSRTILDQMGAEALLGLGDMLYMPGSGMPTRVHGAFVSDEEVHRVVSYLKTQGEPDYVDGVLEGGTVDGEDGDGSDGSSGGGEKDALYDQAVEIVLKNRKASISLVQRHLKIGYNRAARLVEDMEKAGLVSAMSGSGQREILVPSRAE
jgi:S-DNA-T family DNA segregation ATPase FtsK/SpoIIIE